MAGFPAIKALVEAVDAEVSVIDDMMHDLAEMHRARAEMHRARGVTDKCLLAALAEAAGTEGSVPRDMVLDLAELQRVRDLADKRLLAPLAEAASAELSDNTASTVAASANSSSVVSSSSTATSDVMDICKHLSYNDGDGSAIHAAASSTTFFTAVSAADGTNASADSTVTQVAAPADSNTAGAGAGAEGPVLTELHGARGLAARSKRLLASLAEAASAELSNKLTAAALRMRRTAFWRKVLVGIIAATVFSVVAVLWRPSQQRQQRAAPHLID